MISNNKSTLEFFPCITVMFEITYKCLWRCGHCYLGEQKSIDLDTKSIYNTLEECQSIGTNTVVITGGEPTLHENWIDIIKKASECGFSIQLETTNVMLRKNKNALSILQDIDEIHLSIDVPPGEQGLLRPSKYNKEIVEFVKILKSSGCNPFLFCTLYKQNLIHLDELIELANSLDVPIRFNFLLKEGRANDLPEKVFLSLHEIKEIFLKLFDEYKRGRIPQTRIIYQCLVDEDYQKVVNENKNLSIIGGCIAGVVSSTITAYGDVLPCPHLRVPVGNIHNSNFSNIWITSDLFNKLRDRENLKGYCKTCFYRAICGGCRAAAYWRTGDIFEQDPCCFKSLL